jgi:riboflavin biosynthesis pyrimidine reductase
VELKSVRPRIVCHMTMSIDGRQDAGRWSKPAAGIDGRRLGRHYDEVAARFDADGWVVGRVTMEEFAHGVERVVPASALSGDLRATYVGDRAGRDVAVAIDPSGKLHYGQDHAAGDHVIAVVGEQVSDGYLRELREDGVSYLFAGPDGRDLARALATLSLDFGLETLLLEGGGRINGAFLNAGLIDEVSVLVYPGIDGLAGVSSIFEYPGASGHRPAAGQSLRHFDTEVLDGGTVWLRYQLEPAPLEPLAPDRSSAVGAAL